MKKFIFMNGEYNDFNNNKRIRTILSNMVTKRLEWYKNKITSVLGGVKVIEKDGYYVFIAEKRTFKRPVKEKKKQGLSKKLKRKLEKKSKARPF